MTNRNLDADAVLIQEARMCDAKVAWEIRNRAILVGCKNVYPEEQLAIWVGGVMPDTFLRFVQEGCYVAKISDKIVGTIKLDSETGKVDGLFVDPGFMSRGVGKKLMRHIIEIANATRLKKLWLESTVNAAPFYRRCGLVGDTIKPYLSKNKQLCIDCVSMEKSIEN